MWHRIENSRVIESTDIDPGGRFHPSLIWVSDNGAGAQVGWVYDAETDTFTQPLGPEEPAHSTAALLWQAKQELRTQRMPMLDALAGIAGRAQRAGDADLATEADALALQLLDITEYPALNAATTLDDMRAAGVAAYRAIAATASAALASVFKEITGA